MEKRASWSKARPESELALQVPTAHPETFLRSRRAVVVDPLPLFLFWCVLLFVFIIHLILIFFIFLMLLFLSTFILFFLISTVCFHYIAFPLGFDPLFNCILP